MEKKSGGGEGERYLQLVFIVRRVGVEEAEEFCHTAGSKESNIPYLVVLDERLHQNSRQVC